MNEINIQKPCHNCELKGFLEDEDGIQALVLEGMFMAVCEKNALLKCKHPWRLIYQAFNEQPTDVQAQVLSKVVEVREKANPRGKTPEDYNLPVVDKISTLDL